MKTIRIIRHAESIANRGERVDREDTIPLSQEGRKQAIELVEHIDGVPDLIVISPFRRTLETASPLIEKYPSTPIETWDVQEFTYLNPELYNGTTREERAVAVREYWDREDIYYQDAPEVESYLLFIQRVADFVEKLATRKEENILIFSHGNFIFALKKYLALKGEELELEEVARRILTSQRALMGSSFPITNASIHSLDI